MMPHNWSRKKPVGDQPICSERELKLIDPVWLFPPVSPGFWRQRQNRRNYMLWLGQQLGFRRLSDWYRLTYHDMLTHRGGNLASVYWHGSPIHAVQECFPGYDWQEWFFAHVPRAFWHDPENRHRYMEWLGGELGFRQPKDWYRVATLDFQRHRGGTLLLRYRSSVTATVRACFPKHDWKEWMFPKTPMGFWMNRRNCQRYLRWLGERLGYEHPDDWYNVKASDFRHNHGGELLKSRRGSAAAAVIDLIRRRRWHEWKFTRVPPGFWDHVENRRRYVEWLGRQLGYRHAKDWRHVRRRDFYEHCGGSLVVRYHSCWDLLEECLPKLRRRP